MKVTILILFSLIAITAFSVSRVGGGSVNSQTSAFSMRLPEEFHQLEQVQNMVLARGPIVLQGLGVIEQVLQIREFSDRFHEALLLDRAALRQFFLQRNWERSTWNTLECAEVFHYKNDSAVGWVATWGQGRGVVVEAPRTPLTEHALYLALQNLELFPGACAWP